MVGVIRSWDILAHPIATIRSFGWRVFFKAAVPWQEQTFLSLLREAGWFRVATPPMAALLDRCIALELRANRLYTALATVFAEQGLVGEFFSVLAQGEQYHADLLELARAAAIRSGWKVNLFNPWQEYLPRLEQQMDAAEAAVAEIDSVDDALQIVVQIESSEINQVFSVVLAATNAAFVKRLEPFREAMDAHMSYIVERLPELSPNLMLASRELRARFPQVRR
jgi:hypothetical protein